MLFDNNARFIIIDKIKCQLNNLIGKPFGYKYEIRGQQMHILQSEIDVPSVKTEIDVPKVKNGIDESDLILSNSATITKDNRNLHDKTENQKLSKEDIERLKTMGDLTGTVNSFSLLYVL